MLHTKPCQQLICAILFCEKCKSTWYWVWGHRVFAPLNLYSNDAVDFCGTNHNIYLIIRLIILAGIGIAIGLLISKLFSKKSDDDVIDGEVVDADPVPRKPSLLPVLLFGVVIAGVVFFVLPRFGISVMGLLQKLLAFLPLIRSFLPFWPIADIHSHFFEAVFWRRHSVAPV